MSKKAMRRSPTSRNERRKAIAAKYAVDVICPDCGAIEGSTEIACSRCAIFRVARPIVMEYVAKGKRAADH